MKILNRINQVILITIFISLITNCKRKETATLPIISTTPVININTTTALGGGNVIYDGGATISAKGVCWGTATLPTIADSKTSVAGGFGIFNSDVLGLTPNSTYYLRAYATNSAGTAYGNEVTFRAYAVMDIDGNGYYAVTIGTQVWMSENLKTTKFNDGTTIQLVTDSIEWNNLTTPAYCWYNNDETTFKNTYGALYSLEFKGVHYPVSNLMVCPAGWRVPDAYDFNLLCSNYGGEEDSGGELKEIGTIHWNSPNTGATNLSGFTGLPGGYRSANGSFCDLGYVGVWLTSEKPTPLSFLRKIRLYNDDLLANISGGGGFNYACSVRCIKDN